MLLALHLILAAAQPLTVTLQPLQSEVEALPAARLTTLMSNALHQAAVAAQVDLLDAGGLITVTGSFAPEGTGYRLRLKVASASANRPVAFDYKSTRVGEAGALKIAEVLLREAKELAALPPPEESSPVLVASAAGSSRGDEGTVEVSTKVPPVRAPAAVNSVFAEGGGPALAYSVNYERRFFDDLGVRAGLSYLPLSVSGGGGSASSSTFAVPLGVSYLGLRSGKHGLEAGAGLTVYVNASSASAGGSSASATTVFPLGWVQAGYRYHPVENAGFNFRIGVMAFIGGAPLYSLAAVGVGAHLGSTYDAPNIVPWGYVSFGASF